MDKPDKPIRFSTWHVYDTVKKQEHIVTDILVAAEHKHIPVLTETKHYLWPIYMKLFNSSFHEAYNKKRLVVLKIELSDKTMGNGYGSMDKQTLKKYGLT